MLFFNFHIRNNVNKIKFYIEAISDIISVRYTNIMSLEIDVIHFVILDL